MPRKCRACEEKAARIWALEQRVSELKDYADQMTRAAEELLAALTEAGVITPEEEGTECRSEG